LKNKDEFINDAIIIHQNKYNYDELDYLGAFKKIKIICKQHGEFWQLPTNHLSGKGCPKCSKRISKNEILWLNSIGLPNDKKHRNVYLKINNNNNNNNNNKYYVDGLDPINNIVYEYDDDYWHGNLALYDENKIHPEAKKTFGELWQRTLNKKNTLQQAGYKVVSIWESDFLNKIQNKIIIHNNKFCQFITNDSKLFNSLKSKLSYKISGVEYTLAYKNGWNGITYLIKDDGYFYTGLLSKVRHFLDEKEIVFIEKDNRDKYNNNDSSINIDEKLKSLNLTPRNHQIQIMEAACANERGIIRACTGSGKTLCAAMITAKFNKSTIIYVIGIDLLKQFYDLFSSIFDEPIGFIGNGVCNIQRINIASIWTIGAALKVDKKDIITDDEYDIEEAQPNQSQTVEILNMLQNTKIHIFDESHVVTTNTIKSIYKTINFENIYGFSGTPFRDDNTDLLINSILGEQIINISASKLINENLLAQPIIKFISVPQMKTDDPYQTVYKNYIVENNTRNNLILKNVKQLLEKGYTPLVLFKQIKHGQKLFDLIKDNGIKCEMLHGTDSLERRTEVKELISNKKIDVILASAIFDLGVDIPILDGLVLCGGGKSSIRALQRIGRVIRHYKNKKFAAIVDFYDQVKFLKKHSMLRYNIYSSEDGFKVIKSKEMK
jgi:superfamily II DNA or RNA helicase